MSPRLTTVIARLSEADRTFVELTRMVPIHVAAAYLELTISSLRGHVSRGRLRAHKIAGRLYIGDSELERFAERRRAEARTPSAAKVRRAQPFRLTPTQIDTILASRHVIQAPLARTLAEVLGEGAPSPVAAGRTAQLRPN